METIRFDQDIKVFCIKATSFPGGIQEAHQTLHSLIPDSAKDRKYFGISRPDNGEIAYWAAAEETYQGEAEHLNVETLILKKGTYAFIDIKNFMQDVPAIGRAFETLLLSPGLDPEGYCVEWYINDADVKCMVRLVQ